MRPNVSATVGPIAVALVLLAATTGALLVVRDRLDTLSVALLYLIAIVVLALRGETLSAVAGSIVSFLCLNFFFIAPYHTFDVAAPRHVLELVVFLGLALLVSHFVVRDRQRTAEAVRHAREATTLYQLSSALAGERSIDELLDTAVAQLSGAVRIGGCAIALDSGDAIGARATAGDVALIPTPAIDDEMKQALKSVEPAETPTPDGGRALLVPIRTIERPLGMLKVARRADEPAFDGDEKRLFTTFANQIAVAVERNLLREERTRAEVLQRSDELKTILISAVSHELRSPLAAIKAAATSLLQRDVSWSDNDRRELLGGIDSEVDRLNRLIANLLDLSRIQSGALHPELSWNDPGEVIYAAVDRVDHQLAGHDLRVNVADDLPLVRLDFIEIEQVLVNLLENAARYAPAGTRVTVSAHRTTNAVEVSVSDDGPSVPSGEEERIFDTFYRVTSPGAPHGSGIGLAVCRGLVEAHGGRIWAERPMSGGLTVRFTLPLPPEEALRVEPVAETVAG